MCAQGPQCSVCRASAAWVRLSFSRRHVADHWSLALHCVCCAWWHHTIRAEAGRPAHAIRSGRARGCVPEMRKGEQWGGHTANSAGRGREAQRGQRVVEDCARAADRGRSLVALVRALPMHRRAFTRSDLLISTCTDEQLQRCA